MAYFDTTTELSIAQAITTTAASTIVYDTTGAGAGNAPAMIGAQGLNTALGFDIGEGDGMAIPEAFWTITTTGTGAGTITFTVQAAPDNGSYSPGTYQTLAATQAFVGTSLIAGQTIQLQVPPFPQVPGAASVIPRFYRFDYIVSGSATVSVTGAILLNPPSLKSATIFGNNYIAV